MPSNIPESTLDAAKHDDPAWWLEAAKWHETSAVEEQREAAHAPTQTLADYHEVRSHYASAAALACRTFALMMRRERAIMRDNRAAWHIAGDGWAMWSAGDVTAATLPSAAADALREDAGT